MLENGADANAMQLPRAGEGSIHWSAERYEDKPSKYGGVGCA